MEIGKLPMAIVGITIAVIVCAVVLIPVVQESTQTHETFTNEGYFSMKYTESDELTLSWDYTKPSIITVDGEDKDILATYPQYTFVNVLCGDTWFLRYNGTSMNFYSSESSVVSASVTDSLSLTVTASNGSITVANTKTTPDSMTESYTFMYVFDPDGQYVMKDASEPCYLKGDSEIYAIGRSSTTGIVLKLKITGNVDDGFTSTLIGTTTPVTLGDVVATYTTVDGYKDLYLLSKLVVPITYGDDAHYDVTYTYFIVPLSVVAEKSIHPDATTIQLINVIPILVIISIVMLAVATMIYTNRR